MKYQTRHQPVDAVQFQGGNHIEVYDFAEMPPEHRQEGMGVPLILWRREPEETTPIGPGDWVVKDARGLITAYRDSDFHRLYERAGYQPGMYKGMRDM